LSYIQLPIIKITYFAPAKYANLKKENRVFIRKQGLFGDTGPIETIKKHMF